MSFEAINYNNLASLDELNAAQTRQRESWKKIRVVSSEFSEESVAKMQRLIAVTAECLANVKRLKIG